MAYYGYPASRRSAMSRSWGHRFAIAAFIGLVGAGACSRSKDQKGATPPPAQSVLQPALDQGWTSADRDSFYTTPQGSQLIRFDWYASLEQPGTSEPFSADHLSRYGYLEYTNPDNLP